MLIAFRLNNFSLLEWARVLIWEVARVCVRAEWSRWIMNENSRNRRLGNLVCISTKCARILWSNFLSEAGDCANDFNNLIFKKSSSFGPCFSCVDWRKSATPLPLLLLAVNAVQKHEFETCILRNTVVVACWTRTIKIWNNAHWAHANNFFRCARSMQRYGYASWNRINDSIFSTEKKIQQINLRLCAY